MNELSTRETLLKVIWGAVTASLVMYVMLAVVMGNLARESGGGTSRDLGSVGQVFMAIAAGLAVISIVLHRFKLSLRRLEMRFAQEGQGILVNSIPLYVVCWVLNDAICVIGLIWAVVARDSQLVYPFFGVSMALQLPMFPWAGRVVRKNLSP